MGVPPFYLITGTAGTGKTTLIRALAAAGLACADEAGRGVIRHQLAIGGPGLPWSNPGLFAELMLCWDLRSYHDAQAQAEPVFFDRGLPDIIGYLEGASLAAPDHVERAAQRFRYQPKVFVAPPWREIYTNDVERRESFDEALLQHGHLERVYRRLGYTLTALPYAPVADRLAFVLRELGLLPAA